MFDQQPTATDKPALWRDLLAALDALTAGEPDAVATMANAAALLADWLPDLNWAGFYRLLGDELVLGPQVVPDVHLFPGHIACDAASRSELVVPIVAGERVVGVIDLDSPRPGRFDADDAAGCEAVAALLAERLG